MEYKLAIEHNEVDLSMEDCGEIFKTYFGGKWASLVWNEQVLPYS